MKNGNLITGILVAAFMLFLLGGMVWVISTIKSVQYRQTNCVDVAAAKLCEVKVTETPLF